MINEIKVKVDIEPLLYFDIQAINIIEYNFDSSFSLYFHIVCLELREKHICIVTQETHVE